MSLLLAGVAYALLWPGVFGKKADGRMAPWALAINLPYLFVIWTIWWVRRFGSEAVYDRVAPGLWLGRRPRAGQMPGGIELVVDLTAEFPRPPGAAGVEYVCLPTLDGTSPAKEPFKRLVGRVAPFSGEVYVCCAAGHSRSAAVAAAVLIERRQASDVDDAERRLRAARPRVHLTDSQAQPGRPRDPGHRRGAPGRAAVG